MELCKFCEVTYIITVYVQLQLCVLKILIFDGHIEANNLAVNQVIPFLCLQL